MTDSIRVFDPGFRVTDASGNPAPGATIEFYNAAGLVERTVYSDSGLSVSLGDTVTCNASGAPAASGGSGGEVLIYTGTSAYKVIIKDTDGNTLHEFDNISGAVDTSSFESDTAIPRTPVIIKSADYAVLSEDRGKVINADPTGGIVTLTLPSAVTVGDNWRITARNTGTANAVVIAASGGQNINGVTSQTLTYQFESITLVSDGANWHISEDGSIRRPASVVLPQGRLTPTSATPVIATDATSQTTVYYTPFVGNLVSIYDGRRFVPYEFSELSLTLVSQHSASTIYDVYVFLDGTTVRIGTGPAWTTSTAGSGSRGTNAAITRVNGVIVNNISMTARNGTDTYTVDANKGTYLGTILIDASQGQVTCHVTSGQSRKWGIWNHYNRRPIELLVHDGTSSWGYSTNTIRPSNNATANSLTVLCGVPEERVSISFEQNIQCSSVTSTTQNVIVGIGANSTTTMSGKNGHFAIQSTSGTTNATAQVASRHMLVPSTGSNTFTALETNPSTIGFTAYGGSDAMRLSAQWMG